MVDWMEEVLEEPEEAVAEKKKKLWEVCMGKGMEGGGGRFWHREGMALDGWNGDAVLPEALVGETGGQQVGSLRGVTSALCLVRRFEVIRAVDVLQSEIRKRILWEGDALPLSWVVTRGN